MSRAGDPTAPLPLEGLRAHVEAGATEPVRDLALRLNLPLATVRGTLSSYADATADPSALRVCRGTSCLLAGGPAAWRDPATSTRPVYCLGYCDRAPAAMLPDGRVVVAPDPAARQDPLAADAPLPGPCDIRCAARQPIVTRRILARDTCPSGGAPPYDGLDAALSLPPSEVIEAIVASGERGRGGAAFPTGAKWRMAAETTAPSRVVVANGDEGDPGAFIDRELMERDPHAVLEGVAICAHAIGADRGIVFIRSEYPAAAQCMQRAIDDARRLDRVGAHALGRGRPFHVRVVRGMGAYVCGEETALLAALEGRRPEARPRPPYPAQSGLFGLPTVVDNVETLSNVPWILRHGAGAYAALGTPDSRGTKAICLARGFARPGIVEVEFGTTLGAVIEQHGGGGAEGRRIEAVLLGGPMGSLVGPEQWDTPLCYTEMARRGIRLGHGGIVPILAPADWHAMLRHLVRFAREESCGRCVPCSLGAQRADALVHGALDGSSQRTVEAILDLMRDASLCAFGRDAPGPIRAVLDRLGPNAPSHGVDS